MAIALATGLALTIVGLSPFDFSLELNHLKISIKDARLVPFGKSLQGTALPPKPWSWTGELLTWAIAGGLFGQAAREMGRPKAQAILWAVIAAVTLSFAIEAIQIMVPSRGIDVTSVLMAVVGSTVGAVPVVRATSRDAGNGSAPRF